MKKTTLALALATSLVAVGAGVASSVVNVYTTLPKCNGEFATILSNGPIVNGTSYDDVIVVYGSGPHTIYGYQGEDIICGSDGADLIWGGRGIDWISAGASNDVVHGGDPSIAETAAMNRGSVCQLVPSLRPEPPASRKPPPPRLQLPPPKKVKKATSTRTTRMPSWPKARSSWKRAKAWKNCVPACRP